MEILFFSGEHCGACKKFLPVAEKMFESKGVKFKYTDIGTQEGNLLASKYCIMSLPTILFIDKGKPMNMITGYNPSALEKALDRM